MKAAQMCCDVWQDVASNVAFARNAAAVSVSEGFGACGGICVTLGVLLVVLA
jgi:hypothetical protein